MKIQQHIADILTNWKFVENLYFLPAYQLDRKDYIEVNKILETIGWVWSRKEKAHVFPENMQEELDYILETEEIETLAEVKKKFQFFPTPEAVAKAMIEEAEILPTDSILEPSAWKWAIARFFPKENCITLVELQEENFQYLKANKDQFHTDDINFENFLEYKSTSFDKIIMNPPFSKNQDVKHILHAYSLLKKWGRIVSVASSSIQHKRTALHEELAHLHPQYIEINEWAFKESGTMVNTVLVIINKWQ